MMRIVLLILPISALLINNAHAYVGPGLGLGAIGAFVGLIVSVFLAIVGIIWYPLKRILRKNKNKKTEISYNSEERKKVT
jgi:hypothetical protein